MINALLIFCIGLVTLLASLLFSRKNKTVSHSILGAWLLVTALELWVFYVDRNGLYQMYPQFIGTRENFLLLHPPLLYLYVRSLVAKGFQKRLLVHLIPFLVFFIINFFTFYILPSSAKLELYNKALDIEIGWLIITIQLVVLGYVFSYLWVSYRGLKRNSERTEKKDMMSNLTANWTLKLVIGYLIAWSIVAVLTMYTLAFDVNIEAQVLKDLSLSFFVLFIISCSILGLKQTYLFADLPEGVRVFVPGSNGKRYSKSGLSIKDAEELGKKLDLLMQESKPYLNSKVSLAHLAESLGTSTNHLSQVINEQKESNFADYMNAYRIDTFKAMLNSEAYGHYSILGIALECGFNSKSSFNNVFKKHTGLTPSQYQQEQLSIN